MEWIILRESLGRNNLGNLHFTYYCSAKGWLEGCSLPMEMINTDSMNDLSTETFQLAGEQMAI
jgi:hypothetical protein